MNNKKYLEKIKKYYDDSQLIYRLFWMNKDDLAMHFGYWEDDTKNLHEALINENKHVAEKLDISVDDKILDAGCGVGGTAIWMTENYGVDVTGITIVDKQVRLANKYAKTRGVDNSVNFALRDYTETGYPDSSFDKIYAIESVCHAIDKEAFIREAYRLLKPGGKLCVCDYFINHIRNELDKHDYESFCDGWVMPDLPKKDEFELLLKKNGFNKVQFSDNTEKALRSSDIMKKMSKRWLVIDKTLHMLHLATDDNVKGTEASIAQYNFFKNGVGYHGSFIAEKNAKL
jgi:cyclopropane fatty-acyl-phospholipid synthase-like methyltransferase